MRKSSLDELPQLFNVLRGEMSIVGPRPITDEELERYTTCVGAYLACRPGITGLWQVSGRSDLSYEHMVQLDLDYVKNWSLARDLWIICKTFWVVIRGRDKVARFLTGAIRKPWLQDVGVATVNGEPGLVFRAGDGVAAVWSLRIDGAVRAVYITVNPDKLGRWAAAEVE